MSVFQSPQLDKHTKVETLPNPNHQIPPRDPGIASSKWKVPKSYYSNHSYLKNEQDPHAFELTK
jgi:hypothetical protein